MSAQAAQPVAEATPVGRPSTAAQSAAEPRLEAQIDQALADAASKTEVLATEVDAAAAEVLDSQLADALKGTSLDGEPDAPPAAVVIEPDTAVMAELDATLAAHAESLDDDFLSPEEALGGQPPPVAPTPAVAATPAPAPEAKAAPQPSPSPSPAPLSAPVQPAPVVAPVAKPAPAPAQPASLSTPTPAAAAVAPSAQPASNGIGLGDMVASAIEPIAVRLGKVPRSVQQTVGWIAILTLFHAAVIWGYVLLKSPPMMEEPIGKQPTLFDEHGAPVVEVVGRIPPPKPVEPVAAKESGEGAAKKEDHGAPPAKSGGGGH